MKPLMILSIALVSFTVLGEETTAPNGQVTLPLEQYQHLIEQANTQEQPAPSSYAVGQSVLSIDFTRRHGHVTATVRADVQVETYENEWTLVALLGPGAALESATVNGTAVQLIQRTDGLYWLSEARQQATIQLTYHVDAHFSELAYVTSLPIPAAAATTFTLQIPQRHIDLSVVPSANLVKTEEGAGTVARGTVAASRALMVAWRIAQAREYVLSQAAYTGAIEDGAISWDGLIEAEMLVDGEVTVPLVSLAATLVSVSVDNETATVFEQDGQFAVRLAGLGKHSIRLSFLSAVTHPDGVPTSDFDIPAVPVSRFELTLPGDKELQVMPQASIRTEVAVDSTRTVFHLPMSTAVTLSWMEAIPDFVSVESRANAIVYHALHAAEGVLYGQAAIHYEVTRGEVNSLSFQIPQAAQVNSVTDETGAIADWIAQESEGGDTRIQVFLNRAVSGGFILDVAFEQLLHEEQADITAPILRALEVARQKGMVALLSGPDLALAPGEHPDMSEVGENQLPAFFRNRLEETVSHTYKYHAENAGLLVSTITPERQQGKFNAQVDSLISLGEVTLKGQVGIGIDVKSGVLLDLRLTAPEGINILGVSGPSIRNHVVSAEKGRQHIDIEFTQEMDGQFRIDLNYERIMLDGAAETSVPRVEVDEADVEHGRIAIEALTVLEVQASIAEQLSTLEINELPRQLVLKTTNPILLAFRYVRTERPFTLTLRITRHEEIDVQVAAIDSASYQTLFTTDGLAVTRVQFEVRNSRRQFLRLALPGDTEIWSVFVNGQPQKPAFAAGSEADSRDVLVKMVNSATAFPVELVYATRRAGMATFGRIEGVLPRPDMIVTRTIWDVYVPTAPRYGKPRTNMEWLAGIGGEAVKVAAAGILREMAANVVTGEPLHIELPTQGLLYRFSKLYANQAREDAYFTLRYVHQKAGFAGLWLSLLGAALTWAGIILLGAGAYSPHRYLPMALVLGGSGVLILSVTLLGASVTPASLLSLVIAGGLGAWLGWRKWQARELW